MVAVANVIICKFNCQICEPNCNRQRQVLLEGWTVPGSERKEYLVITKAFGMKLFIKANFFRSVVASSFVVDFI